MHGTITSTGLAGSYVGGLVGANHGTILRAYSTVTIPATQAEAGGLAATNDGTITSSFSTAVLIGSASSAAMGCLVGYTYDEGSVENCGWVSMGASAATHCHSPVDETGCTLYGAIADFFPATCPVYTDAFPWDFETVWLADPANLPILRP